MNQCSKLLNHLMRYGSITSSLARSRYGIKSLAARVKDMRSMGFRIEFAKGIYSMEGYRKAPVPKVVEEDDIFPEYTQEIIDNSKNRRKIK